MYGESILVSGNIAQLGNWDPSQAVALNASQYTAQSPLWYVPLGIPPGTSFQYKYISAVNGTSTFEAGSNRAGYVASPCVPITEDDSWQYAVTTTATTSSSTSSASATGCPFTFDLTKTTTYGETVLLVGSIPQLGSWNTSNALPLSPSQYTQANPLWFITLNTIPAGTTFQYKYLSALNSTTTYEAGNNRQATVPASCQAFTENDSWQYAVTTTSSSSAATISSAAATSTGCPVTFDLTKQTAFGENIVITGNQPQLGSWNPNNGVLMNSSQYTVNNPVWYQTIYLTPGASVSYKYVSTANSTNTFEADPDRSLAVPSPCAPVTKQDAWQYPATTSATSSSSSSALQPPPYQQVTTTTSST